MKKLKEYLSIKDVMGMMPVYKPLYEKYDDIDLYILYGCKSEYIYEYGCPGFDYTVPIFEKHGIFTDEEKISKFISLCIDGYKDRQPGDTMIFKCNHIEELKNDCFDTICIRFVKGTDEYMAIYDDKSSTYAFNGNSFTNIYININIECKKSIKYIAHELKHAYQDLQLQKNGENMYLKTLKSENSKYTYSIDDDDILRTMKYVLYILDGYEQSAYISELNGLLSDKKFSDIIKAFDIIYKSDIYKQVKRMRIWIESDDMKDKLAVAYNKVEKSRLSCDASVKKLKKKVNRFWDKFINQIYQCVCNHTDYERNRLHMDFEIYNKRIENIKKYYKTGIINIIREI